MDTRMIDVMIGLVLVFALTSLAVTAIQEVMASWGNSRGDNLQEAVASLLGDNREFARKLLAQPLILSMSQANADASRQRRPSYLTADVFVTNLLSYLASQYSSNIRPATPADLVARLEAKMPAAERGLLKNMQALLLGAEQDWPAYEKRLCAWYDAVSERSIGWFKRHTQKYILLYGFLIAAAGNINPIIIGSALWNDAALRKTVVAQAELAVKLYETETGKAPEPAAGAAPASKPEDSADRAVDQALADLRAALDAGMDFPREHSLDGPAQKALDALRLGLELPSLIDAERKNRGPDAKQVATRRSAIADVREKSQRIETLLSQAAKEEKLNHQNALAKAIQLRTRFEAVVGPRGDAKGLAALQGTDCRQDDATPEGRLCRQLRSVDALKQIGLPIGWTWDAWPRVFAVRCTETPAMAKGPAGQDNGKTTQDPVPVRDCQSGDSVSQATEGIWSNLAVALAGWLATAIAATLGAPFWFDLLGKLVKLRSSGSRVESGTGTPVGGTEGKASTLTSSATTGAGPDSANAASEDAMSEAERRLTEDEVTLIQRKLEMPSAQQTGRLDLTTREAIKAWQRRTGVSATGVLTEQQAILLLSSTATGDDDGYLG